MELEILGERLVLDGRRAIVWPREQLLFVADTHFGKAATFRRAGLPISPGSTAADLSRLEALCVDWSPRRLIVLGDFLHARSGNDEHLAKHLIGFQKRIGPISIDLVTGNHDLHAGALPQALQIERHTSLELPPFSCRHHPPEACAPETLTLCGHLHPVVQLRENRRAALRLPCFALDRGHLVLPAFSSFTDGLKISLRDYERVFAIADDQVVEVGGGRAATGGPR